MKSDEKVIKTDVEFVRIFFPSPAEEILAVRIARMLASFVGEQVIRLRADTSLKEVLSWADSIDAVKFITSLEEILGQGIDDEFAADFENRTFRELVEYAARGSRGA